MTSEPHDRAENRGGSPAGHLGVDAPWTMTSADVLQELGVDADNGLGRREASRRLARHGPNRLQQKPSRPAWSILLGQVRNLIVLLLAAAAAMSWVFGQRLDSIAILIAIGLNVAFGFFTELRATRSMEALQRVRRSSAAVRRGGATRRVPSTDLVPGDVVALEAGDRIPADMRVLDAARLTVDESALTGESVAVRKDPAAVDAEASLAERPGMLHKGTSVVDGSGHGVVTATGMHTEIGRIAELTETAEAEETPLEKRLDRLGYRLIGLTLVVAGIVVVTGMLADKPWVLLTETAIALAVAAAPEGLPVVATIALARGMWRLLRRNAIMNRLSAVETLGSTSVICTDKTGTLTENRMTVTHVGVLSAEEDDMRRVQLASEAGCGANGGRGSHDAGVIREMLAVGVLCNNAALNDDDGEGADETAQPVEHDVGDPLEIALLRCAVQRGMRRDDLLEEWPEVREVAFDPAVKMMATLHADRRVDGTAGAGRVAVKGAPEAVMEVCGRVRSGTGERDLDPSIRRSVMEQNEALAGMGLRVLALAGKACDAAAADTVEPYEHLVLLGLVGMQDPPRAEVAAAVDACHSAGIRVVMVTGDQAPTAAAIARDIGLAAIDPAGVVPGRDLDDDDPSPGRRREPLAARVFARVSPEQKLRLIALHQGDNAVVAMTGDGVNDAPALKKADIGVAMGGRGTQVAREAADMVLRDDAFGTIVTAVAQGRTIFNNIRKFILYLLSGNVGEIMIVGGAIAVGAPLPLLPLQILYLNMISDVFPALALAVGRGDAAAMQEPPRPADEPIITRAYWLGIGAFGALIAATVLAAFLWALTWPVVDTHGHGAVTVSFLTLSLARLWHVFNMRNPSSGALRNEITRNPFVWGALVVCTGLLLLAVYLPSLAELLSLRPPGIRQWALILGGSLVPLIAGQFGLGGVARRRRARRAAGNAPAGDREAG